MTDKEIVIKAIEKAHENGYDWNNEGLSIAHRGEKYYIHDIWRAFETIIYSHDFVKAFWGEELIVVDEHYTAEIVEKDSDFAPNTLNGDYVQSWKLEFPKWKFHLREMILEKEPIKYIEKFL